jgi:predicted enzyme related to lactoylglutathione lyase
LGSSLYTVTVDCSDPASLARFWANVLAYRVVFEEDDEVAIEGPGDGCPDLLFGRSPEPKATKNRIHFDLNPDDQAEEVARLKQLGAAEVDIGQVDVPWVVLADPEGNEFCVLTPRER